MFSHRLTHLLLMIAIGLLSLASAGELQAEKPEGSKPPANKHDLAIRVGETALKNLTAVKGYSAKFVKRERVDGELQAQEMMYVKIRHDPFSVYMYFLQPKGIQGREVIYVEGKNKNQLQVHEVGLASALGTLSLDPKGYLAMRGQMYPIYEMGIKKMVEQLVREAKKDKQCEAPAEVKFYQGGKIDDREVLRIVLTHKTRLPEHEFYMSEIFIDKKMGIPLRYVAWDWPKKEGEKPELIQEYTYFDIKPTDNLTDKDFDVKNPGYNFP